MPTVNLRAFPPFLGPPRPVSQPVVAPPSAMILRQLPLVFRAIQLAQRLPIVQPRVEVVQQPVRSTTPKINGKQFALLLTIYAVGIYATYQFNQIIKANIEQSFDNIFIEDFLYENELHFQLVALIKTTTTLAASQIVAFKGERLIDIVCERVRKRYFSPGFADFSFQIISISVSQGNLIALGGNLIAQGLEIFKLGSLAFAVFRR